MLKYSGGSVAVGFALLLWQSLPAQNLVVQGGVAGEWLVTTDLYGNPLHQRLVLKVDDGKLTGTLSGDALSGNAVLTGGQDPTIASSPHPPNRCSPYGPGTPSTPPRWMPVAPTRKG